MADIRTNSNYLYQIELAVEQIQMKKDLPTNLEIIRKMLNLEFKAKCERVLLTVNDTTSYFFGAHVFPSKKELFKIADKVIMTENKVQFEYCSEFILELDSKLIYGIGATPREIVAVILHEIGHKVYSKREMIRSKVNFMNVSGKYVGIGIGLFKIVSPLKFLLFTAILIAFSSSFEKYLNIKNELDADSFAIKYGYGVDLHSLLDKLTSDNLKGLFLSTHGVNNAKEDTEKAIMEWSFKNILDFSLRKSKILKDLKEQYREEKSEYLKEILADQIAQIEKSKTTLKLGFVPSNTPKVVTKKMSMKEQFEFNLSESIKSFMEVNATGMSDLELDELLIEIDKIETQEDKIYVVSRIYRNLEVTNRAINAINNNKKDLTIKSRYLTKDRLPIYQEHLKKLNEILTKVRALKIKEKEYGFFIKYPEGDYEQ